MNRWGLVGLMALAACAPENTLYTEAQGGACPGVTAGALTDEARALTAPSLPLDDGREPFIIRYRDDGVSAASRVRQFGGQVTATFRSVPAVAARLSSREREALAKDPSVESIEPDQVWHSLGAATAPALSFASAAARGRIPGGYAGGLRQVQANEVWDLDEDGQPDPGRPTGAGTRVCIIDSGLDMEHPSLRQAVVASWDFLDGDTNTSDGVLGAWGSGHGTHVAGIVAARPGAPIKGMETGSLVGVAPGTELVIARVLDLNGRTQMSIVLAALEYCSAKKAKVASLSLGGGFASKTTLEAFQAAYDSGMLVVAASGNDGGQVVSYPASDPSVLAVGAVDDQGRRADFSSGGHELALVAPGVDVLSLFPRGLGGRSEVLELDANETQLMSRPLQYSPAGTKVAPLVDCGAGDSLESCKDSTCSGFIAYVRPGFLPIEQVMVNVMKQGAQAVIIGNEVVEGGLEIFSLPRRGRWVPAVTINQAGGTMLDRVLGYNVRVHVEPTDYTHMSGTSMSTPYVVGVAALLFSAHPSATPAQVREALVSTARDLGPVGHDEGYGHGMVQARRALESLSYLP
ncbi:S8 family serine peptidase [Pyxidicoccus fallax]|uniref:S8 family serine peptidase n=1 Tax=Pyxidicoccus fallax TaxID=394095 RepID=A0A848LHI6_9BACT|nr:S8 family serine peptidase [Pyxidicoccus fallax]NMO16701.1 S8 family serine peptidase [Pyxidicoccus fallax]NPC83058.1 S8 family serine peptidase [Pyxidicoccus fallax]